LAKIGKSITDKKIGKNVNIIGSLTIPNFKFAVIHNTFANFCQRVACGGG
jgi:hypothetical protein